MADKKAESDKVQMTHPKLKDSLVTVSRTGYEKVWKGKGWELASSKESK
jgi:hypothetical protein